MPKSWGCTEVCGIYGIAGFGGRGGSRIGERSLPALLAAMGRRWSTADRMTMESG